jgi:DeoR family suf operon transcriptional repressor
MKNTKESILNQLHLLQNATISQLSDLLGISEISVRHHLINLEAEGFVTSSEERHGVGRPRFVYRLTEKGYQNAPTDYLKISDQALDTMKSFLGTDTVLELLKQLGRDLADGYSSPISSQDPDQKLAQISTALIRDGFIFSWTNSGETYTLITHHCPFHYLGQKHPEVCAINHALLESLIQHPINHNTCILRGDVACTYTYEADNGK